MADAALVYEISVPMVHNRRGILCPPVTENRRGHWSKHAPAIAFVRNKVAAYARKAGIPKGSHLDVTLHYAPGDNRARDADNLVPTLKAACDALARGKRRDWVGLELVPDDTPEHMTKHMPIIHPGKGKRRLWIEVEVTP